MNEHDVLSLLKAVAHADGELAAPDRVEARVAGAFRAHRAARARRRIAACGLAAAAVLVAAAVGWREFDAQRPTRLITANSTAPEAVSQPSGDAAVRTFAAPIAHPGGGRKTAAPTRLRAAASSAPAETPVTPADPSAVPGEVVTEFFPLMDPSPPMERGAILRVRVPRSAMQAVGLPVREERLDERVEADVLVGEEGLPRAIRFVAFPMK